MSSSNALETLLLRLCIAIEAQNKAIKVQARAIGKLAESNEAMVDTIATLIPEREEEDDDDQPRYDLAGRPIRQ